ncbi:MAG: tetratricopeptide repeat protein [Ignavibacteriae bacterium]|nr:tetratricopeptide repeat protein [Ignavibacteriota bacterium]NOG96485.1 tetratricopeptide repeat protein [Ignavibacteriota bacterium]
MSRDKNHIAIIRFLKNELGDLFIGVKKKNLLKEIDEFNKILSRKENAERTSELNLFYNSVKYRRAVESLLTSIKTNLTPKEYSKFVVKFAKYAFEQNEPKLAIDLCYKIITRGFGSSKNLKLRAEAYLILSDSFLNQAYWEESLSYLKLAEIIYKTNNDNLGLFECYNRAGIIDAERGNIKKASKKFEKALKLLKPKKNQDETQKIKVNLGIIYTILDKDDKAEKYLSKSLNHFIEKKDTVNTALAYHNLGMHYYRNGKIDESQKNYNRSLSISTRNNFMMPRCITLISKAQLALSKNSFAAASRFALQGLNLAIKINDQLSQAEFYKINGSLHTVKKNYKLAENNFKISLRINKELNSYLNYSETAIELGKLYAELNDIENAKHYLSLAKLFYEKNNIKRELEIIKKIENNLSTSS